MSRSYKEGNLSNHEEDKNDNGKKKKNLVRPSRLSAYFFAVLRLRTTWDCVILLIVEDVNPRQRFFFLLNLIRDRIQKNSSTVDKSNDMESRRVWWILKTEESEIHFSSPLLKLPGNIWLIIGEGEGKARN